ncbi:MAG TPA: modification methylase [Desulfosporosinus sp.]|nr:modification methylase [Desulfosporosinus sp.]
MDEQKNKFYFGDNLVVLRSYVQDESIDLIYLDPPFNSKANYNVFFSETSGEHSAAQVTAFNDTWHWGHESNEVFYELITKGPKKLSDFFRDYILCLAQTILWLI